MASPRLRILIVHAAVLLASLALAPNGSAQQSSQSGTLSYDQMKAAEDQAAATQAAAAAKHGKKKSAAPQPAPAPAPAPAPTQPVAAQPAPTQPAPTQPVPDQPTQTVAPTLTVVTPETPAPAAAPAPAPPAPAEPPSSAAEPAAAPAAVAAPAAHAANTAANVPPVASSHGLSNKYTKVKVKKEKPPKLVPVNIVHGELTVDGLIAKAGLNFQIPDLKYLYIWVPGLGTAIASNEFFPGSKLQPDALDGQTVTLKVEGHQLQLSCDRDLLGGKKPKPLSLYVAFDPSYQKPSNYPEFGYGTVREAPYSWPGTLVDLNPNTRAPALPDNLRQSTDTVKTCHKNADGTQTCRTVDVPMIPSKS